MNVMFVFRPIVTTTTTTTRRFARHHRQLPPKRQTFSPAPDPHRSGYIAERVQSNCQIARCFRCRFAAAAKCVHCITHCIILVMCLVAAPRCVCMRKSECLWVADPTSFSTEMCDENANAVQLITNADTGRTHTHRTLEHTARFSAARCGEPKAKYHTLTFTKYETSDDFCFTFVF